MPFIVQLVGCPPSDVYKLYCARDCAWIDAIMYRNLSFSVVITIKFVFAARNSKMKLKVNSITLFIQIQLEGLSTSVINVAPHCFCYRMVGYNNFTPILESISVGCRLERAHSVYILYSVFTVKMNAIIKQIMFSLVRWEVSHFLSMRKKNRQKVAHQFPLFSGQSAALFLHIQNHKMI